MINLNIVLSWVFLQSMISDQCGHLLYEFTVCYTLYIWYILYTVSIVSDRDCLLDSVYICKLCKLHYTLAI